LICIVLRIAKTDTQRRTVLRITSAKKKQSKSKSVFIMSGNEVTFLPLLVCPSARITQEVVDEFFPWCVKCLTSNKPFHFGADPDHDQIQEIFIGIFAIAG